MLVGVFYGDGSYYFYKVDVFSDNVLFCMFGIVIDRMNLNEESLDYSSNLCVRLERCNVLYVLFDYKNEVEKGLSIFRFCKKFLFKSRLI